MLNLNMENLKEKSEDTLEDFKKRLEKIEAELQQVIKDMEKRNSGQN